MLDIACIPREDQPGIDIPVGWVWNGVLGLAALDLFILLPFTLFVYNQKGNTKSGRKMKLALCPTISLLVIHVGLICVIWFVIKTSNLHFTYNKAKFSYALQSESKAQIWGRSKIVNDFGIGLSLTLFNSLTVYLATIGSIFWVFIGGFGLANAPLILITSWLNRPRLRDAEDQTFTRLILRAETEKLITQSKEVNKMQDEYN